MIVYHIDRAGSLCEGMELTLSADGLSRHGQRYWRSPNVKNVLEINDYFIEHIFEEVRLAHYPDRPSRFVSLFGSPTVTQLNYWGTTLKEADDPPVWQIDSPSVWLADAALLRCMEADTYNLARARSNAHRYWQGALKYDSAAKSCVPALMACPSAEALISLPARVLYRF